MTNVFALLAATALLCPSSNFRETLVRLSPYENSTRRLVVEVRSDTTEALISHSRPKWGKALREAAGSDRRLVVTASETCSPKLVRDFMVAALERYGHDSVVAAEGGHARWEELASEVQAVHGPLVLRAAPPGEDDPRALVGVDGRLYAPTEREALIDRLEELHRAAPDQRWIFDFRGLGLAPLAVWQGLPRETGHARFSMRGIADTAEPRWMAADREPAILEIAHDGSISRGGDVLTDAKGKAAALSESERDYADRYFGSYAGSPYEAAYLELARLFEGSAKARIHTRPFIEVAQQRVLLRVHDSTPWIHVERLLDIAAATRLPHVDLALLQRPLEETEPIDMLVDHEALEQPLDAAGAPVSREPVAVQVQLVQPGERIESMTYSPFDGALIPAWRFDARRKIRFGLENGSADSLEDLTHLFESSKRGGAEFCLVIDCEAGVTVGDVFPLIQSANRLSLTPISFRMSALKPAQDYDSR
ncbi:MAG: hypothetical protein AAGG01_03780 [Planctomycetota bacterium]